MQVLTHYASEGRLLNRSLEAAQQPKAAAAKASAQAEPAQVRCWFQIDKL